MERKTAEQDEDSYVYLNALNAGRGRNHAQLQKNSEGKKHKNQANLFHGVGMGEKSKGGGNLRKHCDVSKQKAMQLKDESKNRWIQRKEGAKREARSRAGDFRKGNIGRQTDNNKTSGRVARAQSSSFRNCVSSGTPEGR